MFKHNQTDKKHCNETIHHKQNKQTIIANSTHISVKSLGDAPYNDFYSRYHVFIN